MRTLLWKELTEQWRSSRLLITVAVLGASGILGPLSAKYLPVVLAHMADVPEGLAEIMPEPDAGMAVMEYADNVVQLGVVLAILLPMAAVVAEKAAGTAEITLSKPVSRAAFLLAKFVGCALSFTVGLSVAALAGYYYTGVLFRWLPIASFMAANALILLYLLVIVGFTLLASTVARSQLAAAGMAVGVLVLLGLLGGLPPLRGWLPAAMLDWARGLALSLPTDPGWRALAVSVTLVTASLLAAWLVFRRQEL
jgi:ABC-2 type transport system permease protein